MLVNLSFSEKEGFTCSYSHDFENYDVDVSGVTEINYDSWSTIVLKLKGDFLKAPSYYYDFETHEAVKRGDVWELTLPSGSGQVNINVDIELVKEEQPPEYAVTIFNVVNEDNVSVYYSRDYQRYDVPLNTSVNIPNGVWVYVEFLNGVESDGVPTGVADDKPISMEVSGDKYVWKNVAGVINVVWELKEKSGGDFKGLQNVYSMDEKALFDLSNRGWWVNDFNGEPVDGSQFFINMIKYPFNIDGGEREPLKLGTYSFSEVEAKRIENVNIVFDLGSYEVKPFFNNSKDYFIKSRIYLPLTDVFFDIDAMECINKILRVEYVINPIDGGCTINIYLNEIVHHIIKVNIGVSIPYKAYLDSRGVLSDLGGVYNGIKGVVIERRIPKFMDGVYNSLVECDGGIDGVEGFVIFDNVDFCGIDIPKDESDLIIDSLKNGVIL